MKPAHVLILAGRRDGDASVAGVNAVSHKALSPVAGVPMLERVAVAVHAALPDAKIHVVIDPIPEWPDLAGRLNLNRIDPGPSPATSVAKALKNVPTPVLVVTADHALLTPEMVICFLEGVPEGADGAVGVARRETIEAKYQTKRTYWRFADASVSGCNLFYLGAGADKAIAFWHQLEADRKHPLKVVRRLGPVTLALFGMGWLSLANALKRLSKVTGAHLAAVDMPQAEAAIDVDKPEDLILVERILAKRAS